MQPMTNVHATLVSLFQISQVILILLLSYTSYLIEQETNSAGVYENTTACENPKMTASLSSSCGTMTWVSENRTCSLMTYTGQVCKKPLLEWQNCIAGQNSSNVILISTVESQLQLEQQVIQTFEVIGQFNKCTMYLTIVIPLILYMYFLLYTQH